MTNITITITITITIIIIMLTISITIAGGRRSGALEGSMGHPRRYSNSTPNTKILR
jgi:hypothetical protein